MQSDWVHSPNPSRRFVPRLAVMATARPPIVMRVGQPLKRGRDRSAGATEFCRRSYEQRLAAVGGQSGCPCWHMTAAASRFGLGWPRFVVPGCDDGVMSPSASSGAAALRPAERLEVLFEELAELAGQR